MINTGAACPAATPACRITCPSPASWLANACRTRASTDRACAVLSRTGSSPPAGLQAVATCPRSHRRASLPTPVIRPTHIPTCHQAHIPKLLLELAVLLIGQRLRRGRRNGGWWGWGAWGVWRGRWGAWWLDSACAGGGGGVGALLAGQRLRARRSRGGACAGGWPAWLPGCLPISPPRRGWRRLGEKACQPPRAPSRRTQRPAPAPPPFPSSPSPMSHQITQSERTLLANLALRGEV